MPRAFTSADMVQGADGTPGPASAGNVALPGVGTEGNSGLIVMCAQTDIAPPQQWHSSAVSGTSSIARILSILIRPDLADGDQSWTFPPASVGTPVWLWRVEEWTNFSFAAELGSARTTNVSFGLTSISTGTTGTWDGAEYALGIAAVGMLGSDPAVSAADFPSVTGWSNGFTETTVLQQGPGGSGNADLKLWVARKYGAAGDTGAWETTATFSAAAAGKIPWACIAVFRAEHFVGEA